MKFSLPTFTKKFRKKCYQYEPSKKASLLDRFVTDEKRWSLVTGSLCIISLFFIFSLSAKTVQKLIVPILNPMNRLHPLTEGKSGSEIFGFAPYWTIDKLDNVDFNTLTTLAYFNAPILPTGDIDKTDIGYTTFISQKATDIFQRAHKNGTRVVLTITQMDNESIDAFLSDSQAQSNAIDQTVAEVKKRGIDGVNVDFEYSGTPADYERQTFTQFVSELSQRMHRDLPESKVTVSVYALSARDPQLYDIGAIAKNVDGIFMMAYDFAAAGSDNATPTAPLYGHKSGHYSYDISTAVTDFLKVMPANKLILGVPYYGYNYLVYRPAVNASTLPYYSWQGSPVVQTYAAAEDTDTPNMDGIDAYRSGWDAEGQVSWRAYHETATGAWRMIFLDDTRSLAIKYDFAKSKNLGGVGIWALGFDNGKNELWALLREKFGTKFADSRIVNKQILAEN